MDAIDFALTLTKTLDNLNALIKELETNMAKEWSIGKEGITHFIADAE